MKKISYAITVCNELEEFKSLVDFLLEWIRSSDEIVIQQDAIHGTDEDAKEVWSYTLELAKLHRNVLFTTFPLKKDFASFKNNLGEYCKGDYIFQLDADEKPSVLLVEMLPDILDNNKDIDLIHVPRENFVTGLTEAHINQWHWAVDDQNRVNYPDLQGRIYKNDPNRIKWEGKVHEVIKGAVKIAALPLNEGYDIFHNKTIAKQELQNQFYGTIQ